MWSSSFFWVALPAIFTIVNPLGAIGPFMAMTARDSQAKKASAAKRACLIAGSVLTLCTALGAFLFHFFGFTLPALKIAGGVLLFNIGLDMLHARQSRSKGTAEEREEGALKDDVAVFPLGIPLLCGPGSMVTVLILGERARSPVEHAFIYLSILITIFASYLMLRESSRLARLLGATGMNVVSRIMGLILTAIAVQFILDGLAEALPRLVR
jgi:multiple antibiotic resistance protein